MKPVTTTGLTAAEVLRVLGLTAAEVLRVLAALDMAEVRPSRRSWRRWRRPR